MANSGISHRTRVSDTTLISNGSGKTQLVALLTGIVLLSVLGGSTPAPVARSDPSGLALASGPSGPPFNTTSTCSGASCPMPPPLMPSNNSTASFSKSNASLSASYWSGYTCNTCAYNEDYNTGGLYSGVAIPAASSVTYHLKTPQHGTVNKDLYYVYMNNWDTQGHAIQFGMASANGYLIGNSVAGPDWMIWADFIDNCGTSSSNYAPSILAPLQPATQYTFTMNLTGAYLKLFVYPSPWVNNTNLVMTLADPGALFDLGSTISCGSGQSKTYYLDSYEFETVYNIYSEWVPYWNFDFTDTSAQIIGSTVVMLSWLPQAIAGTGPNLLAVSLGVNCPCQLPTMPHGYYVVIYPKAGRITLANEAFVVSGGSWWFNYTKKGNFVYDDGSANASGMYCVHHTCDPNATRLGIAGWGARCATGLTINTTAGWQATVPTNATTGWHYPGCSFKVPSLATLEDFEQTLVTYWIYAS